MYFWPSKDCLSAINGFSFDRKLTEHFGETLAPGNGMPHAILVYSSFGELIQWISQIREYVVKCPVFGFIASS